MQIETIYNLFLKSTGVSTDTRSIEEGKLFFALRGPSFDGNTFAEKALKEGACKAVVDDPAVVIDDRFVLVDDVLLTLQKLANFHRNQVEIPIIALTGSNGKTTTKELIKAALSTKFEVLATKGNLNNHIGVPLTLLQISQKTEIAVIEMGANHVGEIAELCLIAEPTHGLITNIGRAHIGMFGGIENIIRAKSELFDYLIKSKGIIWVNTEDSVLANMAKRIDSPILYPESNSSKFVRFEKAEPFLSYSDESGQITTTQLIGRYNFLNIAAAKAVARLFNVSSDAANKAIANYVPEDNRSQIITRGSNMIILDAYNANPSSMKEALSNLADMKISKSKRCAILGDMYELGDSEKAEHQLIGKMVSDFGLQGYYVGTLMHKAQESDPKGHSFKDKVALQGYLKVHPISDAVILVKGSRGMKLEEVVEWL